MTHSECPATADQRLLRILGLTDLSFTVCSSLRRAAGARGKPSRSHGTAAAAAYKRHVRPLTSVVLCNATE